jgi:hypothetical protein
MNNIQTVFEKFLEINKNILICLDDTFCFAKSPESKPKNYISITSISDKEEVIECLKEEGSSVINFKISAKGKLNTNITKVVNSLVCILVENSFEPFLFSLLSNEVIVSIVISDRDIRMDDSDYDSQDSQTDYENENNNEEIEKSEDDDDVEKSDDDEDDVEKSEDDDDVEKSDDDEDDVEKSEDHDEEIEKSEDDDEESEDDEEDVEKSEDDEEDVEKSEDDEEDVEKSEDVEEDVDKSEEDVEDVEKSEDDEEDVEKSEDIELTDKNKKTTVDINQYIQSLKNSTKQINKLKRPELIEHLYVLGVKKISGEYLRTCTKESLFNKLNEFLKK